jgi:hypothetical protein
MFYAPKLIFGGTEGARSIFMSCDSGLFFGGTEVVGSNFLVFAVPYPFSAVPRASGLIFMFCTLGRVFGDTDARGPNFMFYAPEFVFGDTEGAGCRFFVLRCWTHFWRYREHRV